MDLTYDEPSSARNASKADMAAAVAMLSAGDKDRVFALAR